MGNRKTYITEVIMSMGVSQIVANDIVERLQDEGVLHLGYGDREVDQIIESFAKTFGTTKTSKYDRWAANRLAQKYGSQAVVGIIGLLAEKNRQKYAPVVNNIAELESKWVSILNFLRTEDGEEIAV